MEKMISVPQGVPEKEVDLYRDLLDTVDAWKESRKKLANALKTNEKIISARVEDRTAEINVLMAAEALAKTLRVR